jgi:hypothetical protein
MTVCTPNDVHGHRAAPALTHGKHLLLRKDPHRRQTMSDHQHIEAAWQEFLHASFRRVYDEMPLNIKVICKRVYFAGAKDMRDVIVREHEAPDGNVGNLMTQTATELKQFSSRISDFRS